MSIQIGIKPDTGSAFYPITVQRADDTGMIFLTCADIPDLFVAVKNEAEIRAALERVLKVAFDGNGKPQVYTNGSIAGPSISTIVRII